MSHSEKKQAVGKLCSTWPEGGSRKEGGGGEERGGEEEKEVGSREEAGRLASLNVKFHLLFIKN